MASKYQKKYQVPENFQQILSELTTEIIRYQPEDILDFCHKYFVSKQNGKEYKPNQFYGQKEDQANSKKNKQNPINYKQLETRTLNLVKNFEANQEVEKKIVKPNGKRDRNDSNQNQSISTKIQNTIVDTSIPHSINNESIPKEYGDFTNRSSQQQQVEVQTLTREQLIDQNEENQENQENINIEQSQQEYSQQQVGQDESQQFQENTQEYQNQENQDDQEAEYDGEGELDEQEYQEGEEGEEGEEYEQQDDNNEGLFGQEEQEDNQEQFN